MEDFKIARKITLSFLGYSQEDIEILDEMNKIFMRNYIKGIPIDQIDWDEIRKLIKKK